MSRSETSTAHRTASARICRRWGQSPAAGPRPWHPPSGQRKGMRHRGSAGGLSEVSKMSSLETFVFGMSEMFISFVLDMSEMSISSEFSMFSEEKGGGEQEEEGKQRSCTCRRPARRKSSRCWDCWQRTLCSCRLAAVAACDSRESTKAADCSLNQAQTGPEIIFLLLVMFGRTLKRKKAVLIRTRNLEQVDAE
jgi:hypothetical protein